MAQEVRDTHSANFSGASPGALSSVAQFESSGCPAAAALVRSSSILEPPEDKTADLGQHDASGSASQVARELFVSGTKRERAAMAGSPEGCSSQEAHLGSAISMESDSRSAAEVVGGLIKGLPPEEGPGF